MCAFRREGGTVLVEGVEGVGKSGLFGSILKTLNDSVCALSMHCMRDICVYVRGHIRRALPQGGVGYMIRQEGASLLHSQP